MTGCTCPKPGAPKAECWRFPGGMQCACNCHWSAPAPEAPCPWRVCSGPVLGGSCDRCALLLAHVETKARDRILNTPEFRSFADAVVLEAQHQRERWGTAHDAGKTDADWLWLLGYLASKALHNPIGAWATSESSAEKKLHRIITVAAAAANWHAAALGKSNMRPGIEPPDAEVAR